jgi:branched-chain amino acid transport system permease protein
MAVGLTLVFKKSGVLNFAHAGTGTVGAFAFYGLWVQQAWPYLAAAIVSVSLAALLGAATYLLLLPRRNDPLMMLIGTLGVSGVMAFVVEEIWGSDPYFMPSPLSNVKFNLAGAEFTGARVIALSAALLLAIAAFLIFRYTRMGLIFRASAAQPYAAELLGINVLRLDLVTWAIAGALAGVAGIVIAPLVGFYYSFFATVAVRGFAAALLAGMTNVSGSLLSGLGLGIGEAFIVWKFQAPGLSDALLLLIIVGVVVSRPNQFVRRTA